MKKLSSQYWEKHWKDKQTGWDIGHASPPLVRYIDQLEDKEIRILIPGAGSAYEAIYLHQKGFSQVYICDWAPSAFTHLKAIRPDFPQDHMIVGDFFKQDIQVDLLLEQTFFCALDPSKRSEYVQQVAKVIRSGGRLAGLMFGVNFDFPGPPFGGQKEDYIPLFEPYFDILHMDIEKESIGPRAGNELFIEMRKQ